MSILMRRTRAAVLWLVLVVVVTQTAISQQPSSSLFGVVVGPDGSPVAEAPIRAVNAVTGTDARIYSSADGRYELPNLPSGVYSVSIAMPCCAFGSYADDSVVVETGQARELYIRLEEGVSLNVLGDDPVTINTELRNRQVIPDLPPPRTSEGNPDLSGVWVIRGDPYPEQPEALPWAAELFEERVANYGRDHPHTRCLPSQPWKPGGATPFITKVIQTPELLIILSESVPGHRQVFLDGRDHPENPNPSWTGHSIGRWEGDTLVVDTVGFNARGWSGNYPRTEMMHLEERYTRSEYGYMDVRVTIEDPGVFIEPWVLNMRHDFAPQEELIEYVCENNKWAREVEE